MRSNTLLIRADAGGKLGTGHVMRMLALAQAWIARGGEVHFASIRCPVALRDRLKNCGITFHSMNDHRLGSDDDCRELMHLMKEHDIQFVALDNYHFRESYQDNISSSSTTVLVVADYQHVRMWHADLVLNQNLYSTGTESEYAFAETGEALLGAPFVLLRDEFLLNPRVETSESEVGPLRVLITFGGVDPPAATLDVLRALEFYQTPLHIRVLAGPANPRIEEIKGLANLSSHEVEVIQFSLDMPTMYQWADRVISAAGSSCYEWMFLKRAGWVTPIAENQDEVAAAFREKKLAYVESAETVKDPQRLARSLAEWLPSASPGSLPLIDGYGSQRICAKLDRSEIWLRPLQPETDLEETYRLATDPTVRKASFNDQDISIEEHRSWLHQVDSDEQSKVYVVQTGISTFVGVVRFHNVVKDLWEIGISISKEMRGKGAAKNAIRLGIAKMNILHPALSYQALIKSENRGSQFLFSQLGFKQVAQVQSRQTWLRKYRQ